MQKLQLYLNKTNQKKTENMRKPDILKIKTLNAAQYKKSE